MPAPPGDPPPGTGDPEGGPLPWERTHGRIKRCAIPLHPRVRAGSQERSAQARRQPSGTGARLRQRAVRKDSARSARYGSAAPGKAAARFEALGPGRLGFDRGLSAPPRPQPSSPAAARRTSLTHRSGWMWWARLGSNQRPPACKVPAGPGHALLKALTLGLAILVGACGAGVCPARQNRKGDQQGTRSYPRRRSAVSIATSTREVMPGTSTGRRPAT